MSRCVIFLGLVAVLWNPLSGTIRSAQAQEVPATQQTNAEDRIAALEEKLRVLESRLAFLEQKLGEDSQKLVTSNGVLPVAALQRRPETVAQALAAASPPAQASQSPASQVPATPLVGAGQEGFSLQSPDGRFRLNIRYQMHLDGRFAVNRDGEADVNTFYLRRAQPILDGTLFERFNFRVLTDFGQGRPRVNDAYIDMSIVPGLRLRAGKFKGPVGLERLMSGMNLPFMERALPTQLAPNRDLGLQLSGDIAKGSLSYAVGVFDGVPDIGSTDADTDDNKEFEGRVFALPFQQSGMGPLKGLGLGVGGSYGSMDGTLASVGVPKYTTTGQRTFFQYRDDQTSAGTVLADGTHFRVAPQGYYYWGPWGSLWEYTLSSQDVRKGTSRATLENTSWQLAATYVLTGEKGSFTGVVPAQPFDPSRGDWGAWELAARFSRLHLDDGAFPVFADPNQSASEAKAWAVGLNWYLNRNVKFVFNYEQTDFSESADASDQKKERVFLQRLQLKF